MSAVPSLCLCIALCSVICITFCIAVCIALRNCFYVSSCITFYIVLLRCLLHCLLHALCIAFCMPALPSECPLRCLVRPPFALPAALPSACLQCVDMMRSCYGNDDIRVGAALHNMAGLYLSTKPPDYSRAEAILREALDVSPFLTAPHVLCRIAPFVITAVVVERLLGNDQRFCVKKWCKQ